MIRRVWIANNQILDILNRQQTSTAPPDIRHTWYQEPVRFEDALGNVMQVAPEYSYGVGVKRSFAFL